MRPRFVKGIFGNRDWLMVFKQGRECLSSLWQGWGDWFRDENMYACGSKNLFSSLVIALCLCLALTISSKICNVTQKVAPSCLLPVFLACCSLSSIHGDPLRVPQTHPVLCHLRVLTSAWHTAAHGPNLACCLFLDVLEVKNGFYIFKWLKKN